MRGMQLSLTWSGRLPRREFLCFAPFAALLPIFVFCVIPDRPRAWHLAATLVAALPLLSAGARRLQDTGEPGYSIMLPVAPLLYFFAMLWLIGAGFSLTLGGTPWYIAWPVVFLFWIAFPIVCLASLFWIGPVVGQLLLPSTPGPNRYGPNPLEVSP